MRDYKFEVGRNGGDPDLFILQDMVEARFSEAEADFELRLDLSEDSAANWENHYHDACDQRNDADSRFKGLKAKIKEEVSSDKTPVEKLDAIAKWA